MTSADITQPTTATATPNGSPSKQPKKPRKGSFKARTSPLDLETLEREQNPMRGFFTLFWVSMFVYTVITVYQNWKSKGALISLRLALSMSKNSEELATADMVMVLSLFTIVALQKLIVWRIIPLSSATLVQHVWQTTWFSACLFWVFYGTGTSWGWTQSGFFVLHCISMLMKQHSYTAYNIELAFKKSEVDVLKAQIAAHKKRDDVKEELTATIMDRISELESELVKPSVSYPNNVTFFNFLDYLLVPTLVYELEYPRTERFRPWYFLERSLATLITFGLLYLTVEHYITPVLELMPRQSFSDSLISLLMPFMVCYLLIFYIIFECICNAFAELTCFADREFYNDWWNSTSFDEYARKWNKPVHEFLLRHIYLESISNYKFSKNDATLLTFFMSACLHELVMVVVGKRVRFYLFFLQMVQIPLIFLARIPAVRRQKLLGNILFWFGMFTGLPLLGVAYMREHFTRV